MLWTIIKDEARFLTFRRMSAGVREHPNAYLAFGLFFTWAAGVGRYWDHPDAWFWQYLWLGSVAYIFVLSAILWLIVWPLQPKNWSYQNVLLFVSLTAPPALLYAIPVERFMPMSTAQATNAWFLAVVAVWRVALYAVFLRRVARLPYGSLGVATLLPLVLIVLTLVTLNLEHTVFEIMAGMDADRATPTGNDAAYGIVVMLSLFSILAAPVLVLGYVSAIMARRAPQTAEDWRRIGKRK
jgi:hypothetical protein